MPASPVTLPLVSESMADMQARGLQWQQLLGVVRQQLSAPAYETWITPLCLLSLSPTHIRLATDRTFNRDWVLKHYRTLLQQAALCVIAPQSDPQTTPSPTLEIDIVEAHTMEALLNDIVTMSSVDGRPSNINNYKEIVKPKLGATLSGFEATQRQTQDALPHRAWTPRSNSSQLNPRYVFEAFVVGEHNRFCHAAAMAVAETPAVSYNPLFLHGGVGLGKTHLMQAIGHFVLQHHQQLTVRYVTAEQFTNDLINALGSKEMKGFRDRYRRSDILMLDDVQFFEGKERTQEEVFHTFNALHQAGKQLILSSDRSPQHLSRLEDRLRSRFEWGLIADITPPDLETRIAILQNKANRERLLPPDTLTMPILTYIAECFPNNIRELEGALNKVVASTLLTRSVVDLPTIQSLLGNQTQPTNVSPSIILEVVAGYYHLRPSDLTSLLRSKDVSHARQVAIYLIRTMTDSSFPKIGELLGGRKHTTILYAYEKIKEELLHHPLLPQQVKEITRKLETRHIR
jgi:chromosomal replication initiator protein